MSSLEPDPRLDSAWRLYSAHVEWIKHADAKLGVLVAASVAYIAAALTFVFTVGVEGWLAATVVGVATVALLCAAYPLGPKIIVPEQPSSFLFFAHTARKHPTVETYLQVYEAHMEDDQMMLNDLAGQTWSLAQVATVKFKLAGIATAAFVLAVVFGAVAAIVKAW